MAAARWHDIDLAKGLAIFLVVLGHVVAREAPAGADWYVTLKFLIYKFHMPFFMCLSGAVYGLTERPLTSFGDYGATVRKRFVRLVPGFALFGVLIWLAKMVASQVMHVDNVQTGFEALARIALRPADSVAASLWYIYVLFAFYLIFPILLLAVRRSSAGILAVGVALHGLGLWLPLPHWFAVDRICEYALPFAIGIVFARNRDVWAEAITERSLFWVGLFAASFLSILVWPGPLSKTLIGLASIPALYACAAALRSPGDRRVLETLGAYTFTIYLMNTLFIGFTKGVMLRVHPWDGNAFLVFLPVLLAAGVVGPILAHRWVLSRIPVLGGITK